MTGSQTSQLIVLDHVPGRLEAARQWLAQTLGERDLGIETVLTELITNAIEHGAGGPIDVTVSLEPAEEVEIAVSNAVIDLPVLPTQAAEPPPPSSKRGRGLFIVRALADIQTEYRPNRLLIRARLCRKML